MAPHAAVAGALHALRRRTWRRPEWPWVALAGAAWLALIAGAALAPAGAGHGAHELGIGMWALMVVAMMLPGEILVLRAISFDSMWHRRLRSPLLFLAAYLGVWIAFGALALGAWQLAGSLGAGHAIHSAAATGALLMIAANWQLAPLHRRQLTRCHRTPALAPHGRPADRGCVRYGLFHARQCVGVCWPLMLATIPGHGIALMLALTLLTTWERVARRPRRELLAGVLGALAVVVMLAG